MKQPNDNSTGKNKIVRAFFCLNLHPQPAWEDKGWRTRREQQAGDDLEEVEVARSTSGSGWKSWEVDVSRSWKLWCLGRGQQEKGAALRRVEQIWELWTGQHLLIIHRSLTESPSPNT